MGVTLSVVFQNKVPKYGTLGRDNLALSDHLEKLDKLLKQAKLKMLESFISDDPDGIRDMLKDSEMDEVEIAAIATPTQWFPAKDGLAAVRAAMEYLKSNKKELPKVRDELMVDLISVEKELIAAEKNKVDFYLCYID